MNSRAKTPSLTNCTLHGHFTALNHALLSVETRVCVEMLKTGGRLMGNLSTRGNVGGDGKYLN